MELTLRRRRRINEVLFDYFVSKYILNVDGIVSKEGEVDIRFLNGLAKELNCNAHALRLSIYVSCARMTGIKPNKDLPIAEEEKVMWAAAKRRITGNRQPLKDYRRGFGNLTAEMNRQHPNLKLKVEELLLFAHPIYQEVIDEMVNLKSQGEAQAS